MAIIPSNTQFIGISPDVNLTEKKSSRLNAETQPYTMQDIIDTAGGGGAGLQLKDGATITSTLQVVADADNTSTSLLVSTKNVTSYGNGGYNTHTAFGSQALNSATGNTYQTAIGYNALGAHNNATYGSNTAVGYNALGNGINVGESVAVGYNAGLADRDGSNVYIGNEAKSISPWGSYNVAVGWWAGRELSQGLWTAVGGGAMYQMSGSVGDSCVAVGTFCMDNGTGNFNTAVGYQAARFMGGYQNVALGMEAMYGGTGNKNIAIGYNSLFSSTTASSNVCVGDGSGRYVTTGSNNIFIGDGAQGVIGGAPYNAVNNCLLIGRNVIANASNQVVIGSAAYPFAPVTAGAQTQTHYWTVKINGTDYKILLAS